MSDSFKATASSTGERPQSIFAEAAKSSPIPVSGKQGPAPKFSFGPISQSDMVDLSRHTSAIEGGAKPGLADIGRSTPIPTSTSSSGTTYQPSSKPLNLGNLSQDIIKPSNSPSSRPTSTPSSSSTAHESSPKNFRFGPHAPAPAHQKRYQRSPAQDRIEAQAARIKALESGFDVVTERYEKASALADKYEILLKRVEKEYVDNITTLDNNNAIALAEVTDDYESQIKAWQHKKTKLEEKLYDLSVNDVSELERKNSSLMDTNKEQAATISSLKKTKAVLRNELTSSLTTIEEMKTRIQRLTDSDRNWEDLVRKTEKEKVELKTKNSEFERQIGEYSMIVSALHETKANLERELRGSLEVLELLETDNDDNLDLLVDLVKSEGENESKKSPSDDRFKKRKDDDDVAAAVHDAQEEALPPAKKELEEEASPLSAPAGFSSEKKAHKLRQDLWFLALLLLYYATAFVIVVVVVDTWKISIDEWFS